MYHIDFKNNKNNIEKHLTWPRCLQKLNECRYKGYDYVCFDGVYRKNTCGNSIHVGIPQSNPPVGSRTRICSEKT